MEPQGSYGQRMAELCRVGAASSFVMRRLRKSEIAITEVKADQPNPEKSDSPPVEDAFIAAVSILDGFHRDLWLENQQVPWQPPQPAGVVTFIDLRRPANVRFKSPFHTVHFYFSRKALNGILDEEDGQLVGELTAQILLALRDDVFHRLALSLLPALSRPNEASRLYVDHVTLAAAAHVIGTYTDRGVPGRVARGGLAPWQQNRAKELLEANLDGSLALAQVAAACRLSTRHFARAFTHSMGMPPHRWLLQRRVERAKDMLRNAELTLGEIATKTGFADQSHLTRVFTRSVGESPGAWRRMQAR